MCRAFKRLRKKSIRQLVRNGPGLKPLVFAHVFVGLKPHAPTEKHKACIFPQPVQPLIFLALLTWAFGPGWYRSRLWR